MKTQTFPIRGMSCASCASSAESMLRSTEGVAQAVVNYASSEVRIQWEETITQPEALDQSLKGIGYQLVWNEAPEAQEKVRESTLKSVRRKMLWALILALPVFVQGMFFEHAGSYAQWMSMLLTLAVMSYSGRSFYSNAWKRLRHGQTNMDTLVALSTAIAFGMSALNTVYPQLSESYGLAPAVYFESAAVIIAFVLLGKYFEERAKHRSGEAIRQLMELQPSEVTLVRNGEETRIPIEELAAFDRVLVNAGERIPVDGMVVKGTSYIDESSMTGEPLPVEKNRKDNVYAGTVNQSGQLLVLAQQVGEGTHLARIIATVKEAQGSKAPAQKRADRLASIFVPLVLAVAFLTLVTWLLFGGMEVLPQAINSAVTVLVIACPCALGLATPTALMVGMGKAATAGILIKDAEQLETFSEVTDIVMDKTGTLTTGKPTVLNAVWWAKDDWYKSLLVAIEKGSDHPLAQAVVSHYETTAQLDEALETHDTVQGKGIQVTYKEAAYYVGSFEWIEAQVGITEEAHRDLLQLPENASLVLFANDQKLLAAIALGDTARKDSQKAVAALQGLDIEIHMLTGDREGAAKAIAHEVGIARYKSSCLPADKAIYIDQLLSEGKVVAMVGDGINDAEALAKAQVGVAMGGGTDVAMETAGITLLHGNLPDLYTGYRISSLTVATIRQNLFWAFAYNVLCIPIAAGVLYPFTGFVLSPMVAGAAMAFSSVSVVLNSLRLKNRTL